MFCEPLPKLPLVIKRNLIEDTGYTVTAGGIVVPKEIIYSESGGVGSPFNRWRSLITNPNGITLNYFFPHFLLLIDLNQKLTDKATLCPFLDYSEWLSGRYNIIWPDRTTSPKSALLRAVLERKYGNILDMIDPNPVSSRRLRSDQLSLLEFELGK